MAGSGDGRASREDRARYRLVAPNQSDTAAMGFWEVAAVMEPAVQDAIADRAFLDRLFAVHPRYSGFVWMDSRGFDAQADRPVQRESGWEAFIDSSVHWRAFDFMRLEPEGRFYLRRLLDDDASAAARGEAGVVLAPVRYLVSLARDTVAAVLVQLEGHGRYPGVRRGGALLRHSASQHQPADPCTTLVLDRYSQWERPSAP
jgi:hypothetical protein